MKYVKGDEVDPTLLNTAQAAQLRAAGESGKEWERMTDLTYTVQSGPLKALAVQWRNSTNRSDYADSANENRLIFRYTFNF
ncbi:Porin-like protein NicP precursor [compost metagenome]